MNPRRMRKARPDQAEPRVSPSVVGKALTSPGFSGLFIAAASLHHLTCWPCFAVYPYTASSPEL